MSNSSLKLPLAVVVVAAMFMSAPTLQARSKTGNKKAVARVVSKCRSRPAKIVVPRGRRAVGFRLRGLSNGYKCVVGGKPNGRGLSIKQRGRLFYRYFQWKNQRPVQRPVRLSKLQLGPGTYWMYVSGGRGARAVVTYTIR